MARRAWSHWALLALAALIGWIGAPLPTGLARLFLVLALGGGLVAALGACGRRWQAACALALLALTAVQRVFPQPVTDPPPSQWTVALSSPAERVRHTVVLPLGSTKWQRWWRKAVGAAVHVCARGPLNVNDGLDLYLRDVYVARVTDEHAYGPRPQPTSVGFYRIPVTRSALERAPGAAFELSRAGPASGRPVEVCGTFTYQPSAGITASEFFDGRVWTSPGPTQQGRYVIELRIEGAALKPIVALY